MHLTNPFFIIYLLLKFKLPFLVLIWGLEQKKKIRVPTGLQRRRLWTQPQSNEGRHEANNEEKTRSRCECLGRWEYHRGCARKFQPSSALHPYRLVADRSCYEFYCFAGQEYLCVHYGRHSQTLPLFSPVGCRPIRSVEALQS
jgi:hypothetical protein